MYLVGDIRQLFGKACQLLFRIHLPRDQGASEVMASASYRPLDIPLRFSPKSQGKVLLGR